MSQVAWAQVSVPHLVPNFSVFPFFNAEYIRTHSIQKISTSVMFKYPQKTLIGSVKKQVWEFNATGSPKCYAVTSAAGYTVKTRFAYNDSNQLVSKVSSKQTTMYTYNKMGAIMEEKVVEGANNSVGFQRYRYEILTDSQTKKYWLNNEQLTYKYQIQNRNKAGQLTDATTRFIRGVNRTIESWQWNGEWLTQYEKSEREFTTESFKYVMVYTSGQIVEKMEVYKDGTHFQTWEYLYEDGLLIAILTKDLDNQCITITKLVYEYSQ